MLKLNLVDKAKSDINYTIHNFPDGQQSITIEQPYGKIAEPIMIIARLNSFRHLEVIIAANQALIEIGCTEIQLKAPYFLGSRSDRKFEEGSINYLKKVITPIINSQGFKKVYVIDPHSDVLEALIDNYHKLDNQFLVKWALTRIDNKDGAQRRTALISPDAGALKKIFDIAKTFVIENVITASKVRDLKTGKILKTELPNTDWTEIEQAVIVDDICDGGRTFIELAKAIRETGYTGKIFLIVTHGIFSQSFLELSRHFDRVFCSNSYSDIKCDEHSDYTVNADFLEQFNVLQ
jgi:ribose-phosphate pyrophosphokinase